MNGQLRMTAYVHLREGVAIDAQVSPSDDRAEIGLDGTNSATVVLFARRRELRALHAVIESALAELDAHHHASTKNSGPATTEPAA